LDNILREPAAKAAKTEHGTGEQQTRLTAEDVAQLPVKGLERRERQKVGRGDPTRAI